MDAVAQCRDLLGIRFDLCPSGGWLVGVEARLAEQPFIVDEEGAVCTEGQTIELALVGDQAHVRLVEFVKGGQTLGKRGDIRQLVGGGEVGAKDQVRGNEIRNVARGNSRAELADKLASRDNVRFELRRMARVVGLGDGLNQGGITVSRPERDAARVTAARGAPGAAAGREESDKREKCDEVEHHRKCSTVDQHLCILLHMLCTAISGL